MRVLLQLVGLSPVSTANTTVLLNRGLCHRQFLVSVAAGAKQQINNFFTFKVCCSEHFTDRALRSNSIINRLRDLNKHRKMKHKCFQMR
jgi:hypothetical protein